MSTLGTKANIVRRFLTETRSPDDFVSYFTEDAIYKVGNNPPLVGHERIREASVRFRQMIKGIVHDIQQIWELGDTVVVELAVTYTRNDDKTVTLPCLDVIQFQGEQFQVLHIYIDLSPVFAP